jgi:serine/threonine-protein kinase
MVDPPSDGSASAPSPVSQQSDVYAAGNVIAGKYRLMRVIGQGGMGSVWLAHNTLLDIDLAIKLIRRDLTAPEAAERLLQEARAVARLQHSSIVRVFDFGASELGDPFIAMELLEGEPLSAVIQRKGRLSPAVAVQTLLPVASALVSAHSKGIVHRDLKPDNIILVRHENGLLVPKIVDFGIAKLLSADVERKVTMAGEVIGSPDYMSPEQARGAENVGEATDIWTFSVLLYEALTGHRPFDGPNYNALIASILLHDPVAILDHGVDEPVLWSILQRGLTKSTESRWPTMRDLGNSLAAWAVERGIEDDVAGNPIARQWLSGSTKRVISDYPEVPTATSDGRISIDPPLALSFPGSDRSILGPPWEPLPAPSRKPLLIIVGGCLMALAAAGFLARDLSRGRRPSDKPSLLVAATAPAVPSAVEPAPSANVLLPPQAPSTAHDLAPKAP